MLELTCDTHADRRDCPDVVLDEQSSGEIVLLIHDGGHSGYKIDFCPFCGVRL